MLGRVDRRSTETGASMPDYITPARDAKVTARVTPRDRRLIERAAEEAGVTVSRWVADRATRNARMELPGEDGDPPPMAAGRQAE